MRVMTESAKIKRLGMLTSGGDAPGMNAAIRAVVLSAHHYHIEVIGFHHGFNGLIVDDNIKQAKALLFSDVNHIIHLGGTILKSARCPLMLEESGLLKAGKTLKDHAIDALVVIGGDGSFHGLLALQKYWSGKVIGIPGTIDNDLDGTDYTIGFATAVNTGIEAVDKIRDTADAFERIFIVELMGRHSGHITFNVGIACAAEQVLSFENFPVTNKKAQLEKLAEDITLAQQQHCGSYIIVIAENLWQGGAIELARALNQYKNINCTACTLGHIQRGGSPVAKDRILATKMGVAAVQALLINEHNVMVGELNNMMKFIPLVESVKHHKLVSKQLIDAQENILALTAQHQW